MTDLDHGGRALLIALLLAHGKSGADGFAVAFAFEALGEVLAPFR
ncbi:hypothetical protein [Pseudarthrobacter sp. S9]